MELLPNYIKFKILKIKYKPICNQNYIHKLNTKQNPILNSIKHGSIEFNLLSYMCVYMISILIIPH